MITVVVVVLLMRGRFGLGCRRRRRLRSLIALRRRRIKYHAVELYRVLGVSLEWRDDHTKGKGQDRKTLHRSSPIFCMLLKRNNRKFPHQWQGTFP
jgi:hypothetical protein